MINTYRHVLIILKIVRINTTSIKDIYFMTAMCSICELLLSGLLLHGRFFYAPLCELLAGPFF